MKKSYKTSHDALSKLAMQRELRVEKIMTKSASRKIDLQCAEFELGSA